MNLMPRSMQVLVIAVCLGNLLINLLLLVIVLGRATWMVDTTASIRRNYEVMQKIQTEMDELRKP